MQASKNGFFYVIDRLTGEFLSAEPFAAVNWARGVDKKTGRPLVNDEAYYGAQAVGLSPGIGGAHNWAPAAFNPMTGLVYIPASTLSTTSHAAEAVYNPLPLRPGGESGTVRPEPPPTLRPPLIGPAPLASEGARALVAWDPVAQQVRWRAAGGGPTLGGVVTTAANMVFQTVREGRLIAYTADKGEKVLEIDTGVPRLGPPITYSIDGKQYVAFMGGFGSGVVSASGAGAPQTQLMAYALDAGK
jgi:quinohemoprotein ethanol dehydrogenase